MVTKLPGRMSSPYFWRSPGNPDGRFWKADGAANFTSARMRGQVGDRFQFPRGGGRVGDGDRVGVGSRRRRQNRQITGQSLVEFQLDRVQHGRRGIGRKVQQQIADVLRHQVDGMVLERRDVRLAAADPHSASDVKTVGLQRLCVDLGDDLRFREVTRADHDGFHVAGRRAQRIGTAAGRDQAHRPSATLPRRPSRDAGAAASSCSRQYRHKPRGAAVSARATRFAPRGFVHSVPDGTKMAL